MSTITHRQGCLGPIGTARNEPRDTPPCPAPVDKRRVDNLTAGKLCGLQAKSPKPTWQCRRQVSKSRGGERIRIDFPVPVCHGDGWLDRLVIVTCLCQPIPSCLLRAQYLPSNLCCVSPRPTEPLPGEERMPPGILREVTVEVGHG
jgi:hypothetical protein